MWFLYPEVLIYLVNPSSITKIERKKGAPPTCKGTQMNDSQKKSTAIPFKCERIPKMVAEDVFKLLTD